MRDTIDHLPPAKRRELAHIVRVIFAEFDAAHATTNKKWRKQGRIAKLVLYGSYARGDWVRDPAGGYASDYDILVVVNDERLTDFDLWSAAEDRLTREVTLAGTLSAPVSFIVHSLSDVNEQLERGRPFFVDIVTQGVALYDAEGFAFAQPRLLPPDEARAEARRHFDRWSRSAEEFILLAGFAMREDMGNKAAFLLHQAAEHLYHCALLVLTLYSPKSHRLSFLRSQAEQIAPSLVDAWPRSERFERRNFELLRQAYVNARYSARYAISELELAWLDARVAVLRRVVLDVCLKHLGG